MKLKSLIGKLEKARETYLKKYGIEPVVSSFDDDEGLFLCSQTKKDGAIRRHKKPYKKFSKIRPQR